MTIKRTGPGPFAPPRATDPPRPGPDEAAGKAEASATGEIEPPTIPGGLEALSADSFDDEPAVPERVTGSGKTRLEDLAGPGARPSQVRSMERLLEKTAARLEDDLARRSASLDALRSEIASSDDVPAALASKGQELLAARADVARLRRRLFAVHRRLKLSSRAVMRQGGVGELRQLSLVAERFAQLKGADGRQALGLTALPGHLCASALRLDVPADVDRARLGSLLACCAPGALIAALGREAAGADDARVPLNAAPAEAAALLGRSEGPTAQAVVALAQAGAGA